MKIGLIRETKIPEDNRVILSPKQIAELSKIYPQHEFVVQDSSIRAYSDDEYIAEGVTVCDNMDDCDILFGIKEPKIESLIPEKHYFSFGHIAKMQPYNRALAKAFIDKGITFSDYEYLTDDNGMRVCAFGWWAGVVGTYYTLQAYGKRYKLYDLPKPDRKFTLDQLIDSLKSTVLPKVKVLITGTGRVSTGSQFLLEKIGAKRLDKSEFLSDDKISSLSYFVADLHDLVEKPGDKDFDMHDFFAHPGEYRSKFMQLAGHADMLLCCHFWNPESPVYLSADDLRNPEMKIRVIGDISCDIMGSVKSTLRASTHDKPFYDYNPFTEKEEEAFSAESNITVMAVDTCPNALARDTSEYFGQMLIDNVLPHLLNGNADHHIIEKATIIKDGKLTESYSYLEDFVNA